MKYKKWLVFIGIIALSVFSVSCGEKKQETAGSTSDPVSTSEPSVTSSEQSVTSSEQSTTSTSTAGEVGAYIDKSEYVMNLFDGKVMGKNGKSGLVYDLELEEYESVQKLFDDAELSFDLKKDLVYPQVVFDSEDGRKFNEYIRENTLAMFENWSSVLIDTLSSMRENFEKNGYLYSKYGVIEGEKYLSIILVNAYTFMDYTSPGYFINSYVFEKETGRLITPVELIQMSSEDNSDLAYEGIAELFRSLVVDEVLNEDSCFNFDHFLFIFWNHVQGLVKPFDTESTFSDVGNIGDLCLYLDEKGEPHVLLPCNDYLYGIHDMPEHHKVSEDKLKKYTWYNGKIVDVPLREILVQDLVEDRLYNSMREHFGIADTPDVLIAYIGAADDYTMRTFQRFVDLFEIDYLISDMLIHRNIESEEFSPRSVYLVIPRYRNSVIETMYTYVSGFSVVSIDQNEKERMPITIRYGKKTMVIHQPVDYRIGEDKIEQDGVYDFTDELLPFDDPTVESRPEIEEFFSSIRTRG